MSEQVTVKINELTAYNVDVEIDLDDISTEIANWIDFDDFADEISEWMMESQTNRNWTLRQVEGLDRNDDSEIIDHIKRHWTAGQLRELLDDLMYSKVDFDAIISPAHLEFRHDDDDLDFKRGIQLFNLEDINFKFSFFGSTNEVQKRMILPNGMVSLLQFIRVNTTSNQRKWLTTELNDDLKSLYKTMKEIAQ